MTTGRVTVRRHWRRAMAAAVLLPAVAVAAGGCFGGGDDPPRGSAPPVTSVPATAAPVTTAPPVNPPTPAPPVPAAVGPKGPGGEPALPPATINPADFGAAIDNPYYPLTPGTRYRYQARTSGGTEVVTIDVTRQTKRILGVPTVVVRDTVRVGGKVVEDTYDWFAQDRSGNVWYFGEATAEFKDGRVTGTAGSWQAGVRGARAGIIMPAAPRVGDAFRQEYYKGEAEDMAEVLSVSGRVSVPYGSADRVVKTRDWTPLEPRVQEYKYYARGVGCVLAETVKGGAERLELIAVTRF
jgi:hypothetical protein